MVLTEAPLAAAVATAFSLPPLPPIPEKKPAAANPPAADEKHEATAETASAEAAEQLRESAPPIAVAEEPDSAETAAPAQAPAPVPSADTELQAEEAPHAPVNGHAAPPAASQPRQGDLLGHADAAGAPAVAEPGTKPADASADPAEEPRQGAAS